MKPRWGRRKEEREVAERSIMKRKNPGDKGRKASNEEGERELKEEEEGGAKG